MCMFLISEKILLRVSEASVKFGQVGLCNYNSIVSNCIYIQAIQELLKTLKSDFEIFMKIYRKL